MSRNKDEYVKWKISLRKDFERISRIYRATKEEMYDALESALIYER